MILGSKNLTGFINRIKTADQQQKLSKAAPRFLTVQCDNVFLHKRVRCVRSYSKQITTILILSLFVLLNKRGYMQRDILISQKRIFAGYLCRAEPVA